MSRQMQVFSKSRLPSRKVKSKDPVSLDKLNAKKDLLAIVFKNGDRNAQLCMYKTFFKWQQKLLTKKIDASRISKRVKASILVSVARYESQTSLHEAFLRWKIRADPSLIKKAVDQFMIYSKISEYSALQRLKAVLPQEDARLIKMNIKKKQNLAILNIALILQRTTQNQQRNVFDVLKGKQSDSKAIWKLLLQAINQKHVEKIMYKKFMQWKINANTISQRIKKQLKILERLGQQYNLKNERLEREQKKAAFKKWQELLAEDRLKRKFFSVLLKTTFGRLQKCYAKWESLPDASQTLKKKTGMVLLNKLEKKAVINLQLAWGSMKDIHELAKSKKTKVIRELAEVTVNKQNTAFYKWLNYNEYAKLTEQNIRKTKVLRAAIQLTKNIVKTNTVKIFELGNKMKISGGLGRLIRMLQLKVITDAFNKIHNHSIQNKIKDQLNDEKKKTMISALQAFQKGNKNSQLRNTLFKFYLLAKRQKRIKEIQQKLLRTICGQVIDTFTKWKSIPDSKNAKNIAKFSKFEASLKQISHKVWRKLTWNPLQQVYYDALGKKRRSIMLLVKSQEGDLSRGITQWNHNVKLQDEVRRCKQAINFFNQLSNSIKINLGIIFENDKSQKIKEDALNKIFTLGQLNFKNAFDTWRNKAQIMRMQDALTAEKKKQLIENLDRFSKNSLKTQLKIILLKFKKNANISSVQDRFFQKLFSTKAGGIINSFNKWKGLPIPKDNEALKKGRKFERALEILLHAQLKSTYDPMKKINEQAMNAKRQCLRIMFEKSMSGNKRAFVQWVQLNRSLKQIEACKASFNFFNTVTKQIRANLSIVLENPKDASIKENALLILIKGQYQNLSVAFNFWRNKAAQEKLKDLLGEEKKKLMITRLQNFAQNNNNSQLRGVLLKFHQQSKQQKLIKEIQLRLLKTVTGGVLDTFNKWKNLPDQNNMKNLAKFSKFEASLLQFANKLWRKQTWNPLEDAYLDALGKKRRSIMLLVKSQETDLRRGLTEWNHNVKLQDEVQRCKLSIQLFTQINAQIRSNLGLLFEDDKQARIKENALNKIFQLNALNLKDAFNNWRNQAQVMRMQDALTAEKKKQLIENLERFSNSSIKSQLRLILLKFKKNANISAVQDRFFQKLFSTKAGGIINSFNKWKGLPIPKDNEALKKGRKFERALEVLLQTTLKSSYDPMKQIYQDAQNAKRQCLRIMLEKSTSSSKRYFIQWVQMNQQQKHIEACKASFNFFTNVTKSIIANFSILLENPRDSHIKENALTILIKGQSQNLQIAFNLWRNRAAQAKLLEQLGDEKKRFLIAALQNFSKSNNHAQLRKVLFKFQVESKRNQLIQDINIKLLKTISGQVFDTFNKWKNLPEPKNLENISKFSKFEASLNNFSVRIWRKLSWNPLNDSYLDALGKKRNSIRLLVKTQESELARGLHQWNHNVQLQDEVQRCKLAIQLFASINTQIRVNLGLLFEDEKQQRIKENAFNKMFQLQALNLKDAFNTWRNTAQVMRMQDALTAEKKKQLIENLERFSNSSVKSQLRLILLKFKKNANISAVQDRFFQKLFSTKAGGIINSFNKWKGLPIPKDNEALKKGRKFERALEVLLQTTLKSSYDPMKQIYQDAQNQKRQCLRIMLEKSVSSNKRYFMLWVQLNQQQKQIEACKASFNFFNTVQKSVISNFSLLLENPREVAIKENAISILIKGQYANLLIAFNHWRNQVAQDKLRELLDEEKKKNLIQALQSFQSSNSHQQLRKVLFKFHAESKRQKLIQDINLRLLRTVTGSVFDTFTKWKNLPEPKNYEQISKFSKFEASLNHFSLKIWRKLAWNPLQDAYFDALGQKKRAVMLIVKTSESDLTRGLNQWNHNVKLQDEVQRCKLSIQLFTQINAQIRSNLGLLFEDDKQARIKENALNRIFQLNALNLKDAFNNWRNQAQVMRMQDALTAEKKKQLIENLERFSNSSIKSQLRLILLKFKKNANISAVQDRFFQKLFSTKAGGIINSFNKWKGLPIPKDNEALKKGRKFERALEVLLQTTLKSSYDPMKQIYQDAQNAKRQCLRIMLEKSTSSSKRYFIQWVQMNQQQKHIEACKASFNFFTNVTKSIIANFSILLENPRDSHIKENALTILIKGQSQNLQIAFNLWRNRAAQAKLLEQLGDEKKRFLIAALQNFSKSNNHAQLRKVLFKFQVESKRNQLIQDINIKLLKTISGQVFDTFNKWKNLPEPKNLENISKFSKFEASLNNFSVRIWRKLSWNPLNDSYLDALGKKRNSIRLLVKTQESELARGLHQWNHNVQLQDEVQRCKLAIQLFASINTQIRVNLGLLFEDEKQQRIKENAFNKMFQLQALNLKDAFNTWRNTAQVMRMQDALTAEKKKQLIENLERFSNSSVKSQLRLILLKFKKNANISAVQDRFFQKLFSTKAGGIINSFNKWKGLPIPKDNEALKKGRKFERALEVLLQTTLKSSYDPMKQIYQDAQNQKRQCLRIMLEKSVSSNKRYFMLWVQLNQQQKQIEACKASFNFFNTVQKSVISNFSLLLENPREVAIKENAISILIKGQYANLLIAFNHWRNQVAQDKLRELLDEEKKKNLIQALQSFQSSNSHQQLRKVLFKFHAESKRQKLIQDINLRLLRTVTGSVFDTFTKWKNLPEPKNYEQISKFSKFEASLNHFSLKIWRKLAWNPLQDAYFDALGQKKRAVMLIVKTSESDLTRGLHQWNHNVKLQDEVQRCKLSIQLFTQINAQVRSNLGLLFEDDKQARIKENALNKIFQLNALNLKDAFNNWRNQAQVMRMQDALTAEKKKQLIENLERFSNSSIKSQLRLILLKFKKNANISAVQDRFFQKLFSTKAGGIINSFNKWKGLPIPKDNEALKKGRRFERALEVLLQTTLKSSYDPMKQIYQDAQNAKRQCLRIMLEKSTSSSKRYFIQWVQMNQQQKHIEACKASFNFFTNVTKSIIANFSILLENPRDSHIKENALTILIKGQSQNLQIAFNLWRNRAAQAKLLEQLGDEKKRFLIAALQNFSKSNNHAQLRKVLFKFQVESKRNQLIQDINIKLLKTISGQVFDTFNKWKNLPEPKNLENISKFSKFEASLNNFSVRIWRKLSWNPLNDSYLDALGKKRNSIRLLVKTQESELARGLHQWNHNVQLQDEVQRCKLAIQLFASINTQIRVNLGLLFEDEKQQRIKENAFNKMFQLQALNLKDAFNTWRNTAQVMRMQDALTAEKKKQLIENLERFSNSSVKSQLRLILLKFKKNANISAVQDRFFQKLFSTKAGGIINSFNKWKGLPIPKDNEALKKGRKFERALEVLLQTTLKSSYDPMKQIYQDAQNQKRQCLRIMLEKSVSSNKRYFMLWVQLNQQQKQIEACKASFNFFNTVQKSVISNFSLLLENPREVAIKENAISILIKGQYANLLIAFNHWRNQVAQDKLRELLDEEKKKNLIQALQSFQSSNSHQQLRKVLFKFHAESKRQKLIQDINLRLLRTVTGSVFDTFTKWKNLPEPKNYEQISKFSKFEASLNHFSLKIWRKLAWNPLQDAYFDALGQKKRAVMLIVKTSESDLTRGLNQWNHNVKLQDEVQRCKLSIQLFTQINAQIRSNLGLLFEDDKQARIKENALNKIFQLNALNLKDAFNNWRNQAQVMRMQDALTAEKKKQLIENLERFSNSSIKSQLRLILLKFKKNANISAVQDRFFQKLFSTKAGGIINSFNKWKGLPIPKDNEALKKGRKFERALEVLLQTTLKSSYDLMKQIYQDAQNAKRQCLRIMLEKSTSSSKRYFIQWVQMNQQQKHIEACKASFNFFTNVTKSIIANFSILLENPRDSHIKENALTILIKGQSQNLQIAFNLWRNRAAQAKLLEQLGDEKKRFLIAALQNFSKSNNHAQLRKVLFKFQVESKKNQLIQDINIKLLKTISGQVFDTFNKWKNLPDNKNTKSLAKFSKFEASLIHFTSKIWRKLTWNPLEDAYFDALGRKKRSIMLLVKTQETELARGIHQWHHNVQLQDEVQKCKLSIQFFNQLTVQIRTNLGLLFEDDKQARIKENALVKIITLNNLNLKDAFNNWRNQAQVMRMQDALTAEKKKQLIENLERFSNSSLKSQLRLILLKFKKNANISAVQDRFFQKLFSTKAGGIINSFNKWKGLPIPKDNEALKKGRRFERALEVLLQQTLKSSYDPMKEIYSYAQNAKRQCLRIMLEKSTSSTKRYFVTWVQMNQHAKQVEACKASFNFFNTVTKSIIANFSILLENPADSNKKESALTILIKGQYANLQIAFNHWRNKAAQLKLQELLGEEKKRFVIRALENFQRQNNNQRLRGILLKFRSNAKREQLINEINLRLFRTIGGQVIDSFKKWRQIPEDKTKLRQRMSNFERSLGKFCNSQWRKLAWNPLEDIHLDALGKQRKAVLLIIKSSQSDQQKAITKWSLVNQLIRQQERSQKVLHFFTTVNQVERSNCYPLFEDTIQNQSKMEDLKKLIEQAEKMFKDSYDKWASTKIKLELLSKQLQDKDVLSKRQLVVLQLRLSKLAQINGAFSVWRHNVELAANKESEHAKKMRLLKQLLLLTEKIQNMTIRKYYDRWQANIQKENVLRQCIAIRRFIVLGRLVDKTLERRALKKWRQPRETVIVNPWLKKVANIISKNARITPQISFWRMRDNASTGGAQLNTIKIIKCKKMFNNLTKAYDRNLTKAFMSIEHYGKPQSDASFMQSQAPSFLQYPSHSPLKDSILRSHVEQTPLKTIACNLILRVCKDRLRSSFNMLRTNQMLSSQLTTQTNNTGSQDIINRMNQLVKENQELRKNMSMLQSQADNKPNDERDIQIQYLEHQIQAIRAQKLYKILTEYQDGLVDDAFAELQHL